MRRTRRKWYAISTIAIALVAVFLYRGLYEPARNLSDSESQVVDQIPQKESASSPSLVATNAAASLPGSRQPRGPIGELEIEESQLNTTDLLPPPPVAEAPEEIRKREIKVENHTELVGLLRDMEARRSTSRDPVDPDKLGTWSAVLYRDALRTRQLDDDLPDDVAASIDSVLETETSSFDPALLSQSGPHLSPEYLKRLRSALELALDGEQPSSPESQIAYLQLPEELADMAKRRKRYSDNYFKTKIVDYLNAPDVSIADKVVFAQQLYRSGDDSLISFVRRYFSKVLEHTRLGPEDEEKIRQVAGESG